MIAIAIEEKQRKLWTIWTNYYNVTWIEHNECSQTSFAVQLEQHHELYILHNDDDKKKRRKIEIHENRETGYRKNVSFVNNFKYLHQFWIISQVVQLIRSNAYNSVAMPCNNCNLQFVVLNIWWIIYDCRLKWLHFMLAFTSIDNTLLLEIVYRADASRNLWKVF